jgi:hypothetical protein
MFKCRPTSWGVKEAESGAVAIAFGFVVVEAKDGDKWESWAEFEEHYFYGDWWIVKKDGTINDNAVQQLVECLGWSGNIGSVTGNPPERIVQVQVKPDVYNGVTRYKGSWMYPEDHTGGSGGVESADPAKVKDLQGRFGALLRASAAAAAPVGAKPPAPKPAPAKAAPKGPKGAQPPAPGSCGHTIEDKSCGADGCAGLPF